MYSINVNHVNGVKGTWVLIEADRSSGTCTIAVNNASDAAELISDFSYLEDDRLGTLTIDFTHMAAPLTQERREAYLPAGFGYQPLQELLEVVCALADFTRKLAATRSTMIAILPTKNSRIGTFLQDMRLSQALGRMGYRVKYANLSTAEVGWDDRARRNLIPLTTIPSTLFGIDYAAIQRLHTQVEHVFRSALPGEDNLAVSFATIVSEAVDNCVEYGGGGTIGGLYYPRVGEVEISLVNSEGGFGGSTPAEQLDALIGAYEGHTRRAGGGGNGIAELSRLALACFGTLQFRSGHATLRLPPDGALAGTTEDTGLPTLGASVTLVLQLLPAAGVMRTESMQQFEAVLKKSLATYSERRTT